MKKAITILLVVMGYLAAAQPPPPLGGAKVDTVKKPVPAPVYQFNGGKGFTLTISGSAEDLVLLTIDPDKWGDVIRHNGRMNGQQIADREQAAAELRKQISGKLDSIARADYRHWADSIPPNPLKGGPGKGSR
jgi:hypothetical protein